MSSAANPQSPPGSAAVPTVPISSDACLVRTPSHSHKYLDHILSDSDIQVGYVSRPDGNIEHGT